MSRDTIGWAPYKNDDEDDVATGRNEGVSSIYQTNSLVRKRESLKGQDRTCTSEKNRFKLILLNGEEKKKTFWKNSFGTNYFSIIFFFNSK